MLKNKILNNGTNLMPELREVVIDKLISTFPPLKRRERIALGCVIQTIHDLDCGLAYYDEVVYRLKLGNKKLFYSRKVTDKTISNLCKIGMIRSEISSSGDGTPNKWKKTRLLKLSEALPDKALILAAGLL